MTTTAVKRQTRRQRLEDRPHALYRFYDRADVLLYIGITADLGARIGQHRGEKPWWLEVARVDVEHHPNRTAVLAAERAAIRDEKPVWNDAHNDVDDEEEEDVEGRGRDLANYVLRQVEGAQRARFLTENECDFDDSPVSSDTQLFAAADAALFTIVYERHQLVELLEEFMALLPSADLDRYKAEAQDRLDRSILRDTYSGADLFRETANSWRADVAKRELDRLPEATRDEWLACATALLPSAWRANQIYTAYSHYLAWQRGHVGYTQLCRARGNHGAGCPTLADALTTFADCRECDEGNSCRGHVWWCSHHASAFSEKPGAVWVDGREPIRVISTSPAPVDDDPWAAPPRAGRH